MIQAIKKYWKRLQHTVPQLPREAKAAYPYAKQMPARYTNSLGFFQELQTRLQNNEPLSERDAILARAALAMLGAKFYEEYNQLLGQLIGEGTK
ncbi:hypothetical protein [uncultured Microscilla sp.]|uniref:hypothetical protein n=1 Tax=uncultured Microscilla sp. TaxID=432653 RepID=UPI002634D98F|nr:hypothetical protein [uncultured Microscilla sp.]